MIEKKLYVCEHCNTSYADKDKAEQCEKCHKLNFRIIKTNYIPIKSDQTGMPKSIVVQFLNGTTQEYKKYQ